MTSLLVVYICIKATAIKGVNKHLATIQLYMTSRSYVDIIMMLRNIVKIDEENN
jgi:hypothetical protein